MTTTRITARVNAARERVFRAFTDPADVQRWMVPPGMTSIVHAFDARVGGRFRVSLSYDVPTGTGKTSAQTDTYHGRFVELAPPERIVEELEFETASPGMQGVMTMTIVLRAIDGGTEIEATHDGLPPALSPADNELGWRQSLAKLAALVEPPSA